MITVACDLCEREEAIPFRCRYCGRNYCSLHRLPPNHDCPLLHEFEARPLREREFIEQVQGRSGSKQERLASALREGLLLRFSKLEVVHLLIATALVIAVGMSMVGYRVRWDFLAIFISAFMVHELGHKFLAQMYHAFAEFRLILFSAAITAFSALPILPFKFIAPGAVYIGPLSAGRNGRVAWIGPLTNIAMGGGFLLAIIIASAFGSGSILPILRVGAFFNAWIAIFNLIPFFGLDGSKIFSWNKIVWGLTLAAAIGLYALSQMMSGRGFFSPFG